MELKPCPCGKTPENINISPGDSAKYAYVSGDCCGEWNIEFRTKYYDLQSPELEELAIKAWNNAPRGV